MTKPGSLEHFRSLVTINKCRWCEASLPQKIDTYEHDNGWTVEGFNEKQWLSIQCPTCKYEWSLWKLGVERE